MRGNDSFRVTGTRAAGAATNEARIGSPRAQIGGKRDTVEMESIGIRVRSWNEEEVKHAARVAGGSHSWRPSLGATVAQGGGGGSRSSLSASPGRGDLRQSVHKMVKQKGVSSGRKYTSKYRGVHQTFPTGRWEAQFRRNGKPTSLGCFDHEEDAAKAYDRMMLWCELHADQFASTTLSPQKQGAAALNFDVSTYANDVHALERISQDDLMLELRRLGRCQSGTALSLDP